MSSWLSVDREKALLSLVSIKHGPGDDLTLTTLSPTADHSRQVSLLLADQEAICFLVYPLPFFSIFSPTVDLTSSTFPYLSKIFHLLRLTVQPDQYMLASLSVYTMTWTSATAGAVFVCLNFALLVVSRYLLWTFNHLRYSDFSLITMCCRPDLERTSLMLSKYLENNVQIELYLDWSSFLIYNFFSGSFDVIFFVISIKND